MKTLLIKFLWWCLVKLQDGKTRGQVISGLKVDLRTEQQKRIDEILRSKRGSKKRVAEIFGSYTIVEAVLRGEQINQAVWPIAEQIANEIKQSKAS